MARNRQELCLAVTKEELMPPSQKSAMLSPPNEEIVAVAATLHHDQLIDESVL